MHHPPYLLCSPETKNYYMAHIGTEQLFIALLGPQQTKHYNAILDPLAYGDQNKCLASDKPTITIINFVGQSQLVLAVRTPKTLQPQLTLSLLQHILGRAAGDRAVINAIIPQLIGLPPLASTLFPPIITMKMTSQSQIGWPQFQCGSSNADWIKACKQQNTDNKHLNKTSTWASQMINHLLSYSHSLWEHTSLFTMEMFSSN